MVPELLGGLEILGDERHDGDSYFGRGQKGFKNFRFLLSWIPALLVQIGASLSRAMLCLGAIKVSLRRSGPGT